MVDSRAAGDRQDARQPEGRTGLYSKIVGREAGAFRDPSEHGAARFHRCRGMRTRNQAMRGVQAFDESRTDVSSSSRFSAERRGRGWPWQLASCSRGAKRDVDELRRGLSMVEALGDDAEGERLDASDSLVPVLTIGHDTRQRRHFG
jgi:hypothetical protein